MARRFLLYLFGVGLGIIVSFFFFGDRDLDFSYFPNARTLKHLRGQEFKVSEKAICQLDCMGVSQSYFESLFYESDLDVDFGASNVKGICKTYHVEIEDEKFAKFNVEDCDSTSTLSYFYIENCDCL